MIDNPLSRLDGFKVELQIRLKHPNYDDDKGRLYVMADDWADAPMFTVGMQCPIAVKDRPHVIGAVTDCECWDNPNECQHAYTICDECINQGWSDDYYFRIRLSHNDQWSDWHTLNDAPGYPAL